MRLPGRKLVIGVGVVVAILVVGGFAASRMKGKAPSTGKGEPDAVAVTVEPVTARTMRRAVAGTGSLWGWEEVPITPKVEGRVVRVHKFVGDVVKPGDVLAEIDPTDFQLAVDEAERALELELSKLNLSTVPTADFAVASQPSVVRAEAMERQAKAKYLRLKNGPRTSITDEETQQAEADADVARANVRQAELEVRATLAAVRHRQATLATARQRLADTKIVAPPTNPGSPGAAEYVIAQRKVTAGETVRIIPLADAPPLYRLVIDRPLKLLLTLPERHLAEIAVGQPVELDVEAFKNETFAGTVARVNRSVDRSTRTFSVEVAVPNADRRLSAGSFVKAAIVTKAEERTATIPEEAVVSFAGVTKVYVLDGGKIREVPVRPGSPLVVDESGRKRTWLAFEGELPEGTPVVTSGQSRLAAGSAAKVRQ